MATHHKSEKKYNGYLHYWGVTNYILASLILTENYFKQNNMNVSGVPISVT